MMFTNYATDSCVNEICIVFQTLFLGLSVFYDVSEWMDKTESTLARRVKYWRDVIFKGMVVPFTLFVTSMFWCVYAIDRELVFPQVYDAVVPWWFNHCVHTNITIVIAIETILQARRKPTDKKLELIFYWAIAFAYAIVYYTIYFVTKRWLYQVFGTMTWWQVCLYQLFIWGISYVFYVMQFPINRLIHGKDDTDAKETEHSPKDNEVAFSKTWSMKFGNTKADENSRL
ncbi:androgen-dependent TFPI-regulating protein-like isoform X3 [Danaus plexippus]|uniref:androgen-dependent TFPI-regulating protein-like isoform X3 n=1 Tax=Danaus plexippus TaxID=13037 RepID=UPI0013C49FCB|nr:androgen-dependent TFPI-regulating protein-like isoform X3 [Danaus plexippus]